jgi:transposase-like protein
MNRIEGEQSENSDKREQIVQGLLEEAAFLDRMNHADIRRERFIKGQTCPNCFQTFGKYSSNIVKYGNVTGTQWQRYRCQECKHTYSDLTNTFFHRSRNVHKWPEFIKFAMVDRLPIKQIAKLIKVHPNTAYAWQKKLMEFVQHFLPNKQYQSNDTSTHEQATILVRCSNKGSSVKTSNSAQHPTVPVLISIHKENPSHVLLTTPLLHQGDHISPSTSSSQIQNIETKLHEYLKKKRGISARNLPLYLTWFRMLTLVEAINPEIFSNEMIKICLDKWNLSRSNRLLKRLI